MLRTIAQAERWTPVINPDGIYGKETAEAVRTFQASRRLPVTGVVDYETWTAIVNAYQYILYITSSAGGIYPFQPRSYVTAMGEKSDLVAIIQLVLSALSVAYDQLEPLCITGVYDAKTAQTVKAFHMRASIYNAMPYEGVEALVAFMKKFAEENPKE